MSGKACIGKDEAMILGAKHSFPLKFLLGGDWNHGILNDFPETVGVGQPATRFCCWTQLQVGLQIALRKYPKPTVVPRPPSPSMAKMDQRLTTKNHIQESNKHVYQPSKTQQMIYIYIQYIK
jgi:hypothetical protein